MFVSEESSRTRGQTKRKSVVESLDKRKQVSMRQKSLEQVGKRRPELSKGLHNAMIAVKRQGVVA